MPIHGGLTPGFERYGGTRGHGPIVKRMVTSFAAQLGTAYDVTSTSNVYGMALAYARAIAEMWSNNNRMANQWDPLRMSDFIGRWEAILGLYPLASDTPTDRRARIATALQRIGSTPTLQQVSDTVQTLVGSTVFVGLIHTSSSTGPSYYTGSSFTNPYGSSIVDWWSNVLHIAVRVQQPAGMSNADFKNAVGKMAPYLDSVLPGWCTWSTCQFLTISLPSGTPVAGFYLDDPVNLNAEPFRV